MADDLLNGRPAENFEVAAIEHGRECDLARDLESLGGLIAESPREEPPVPRPVTDLPVLR